MPVLSDAALDREVFSTDRKAQVTVLIGGELLGAGIDADGNLVSVDITYDIDTMPPTCSLGMKSIPTWVKRRQTVDITAGYNGQVTTIFTGRVKKRRPGVAVSTIECVGRTSKLTQPFRSEAAGGATPTIFPATMTAGDAIAYLLGADGVNFTPVFDEHFMIEPSVYDWAFELDVILDLQTAGDMIRYIADVDGNRTFESRAGTLHVRPLLEAPAPSPFRTYGTVGEGSNIDTPENFDPNGGQIDTDDPLGDDATHAARSQGWMPTVDGSAGSVSFWLKKVGNPIDFVEFDLYNDDGTGLPGTILLGSSAKYSGQFLDATDYNEVQMLILSGTELTADTQYHIVVRRKLANGSDSPPDAANYYLVGRASGGSYAGGGPGVLDSGTWSATSGAYPFSTTTTTFSALRLLDIGSDEDEDQVKKQMIVHGASLSGADAEGRTALGGFDAEGNAITTQVYGESHIVSDDLVVGDYRFFSGTYQHELIQSDAKADQVAERLRDKYYRILDTIEIEVPFDPRMDLGTTLGIVDPRVTRLSGNWWVRAYHHSLTADSANTQISLFGGDQSGTTGTTEPRPDFTWKIEQELIGNAIMQVVTYDASATASPSSKIVDYHWTDDYAGGAMDEHGQDLVKITRAYDPALADTIHTTLEVTDDQGQVVSITHDVDITGTNVAGIYAPVISCAAGNTCMITITGGRSWIDQATPFLEIAKVTAITYDPSKPNDPLIFFFGTEEGNIFRTIDNNTSLQGVYSDVDGDPITCIIPDIVRRGVMWATTTDRVLFSLDFGENWFVYTDFNDPANWSSTSFSITFGDDESAITGGVALGDSADRQRWEQSFTPATDEAGTLISVSLWLKRVGSPNDKVQVNISADDAGNPGSLIAASPQIVGATISTASPQKVTFVLPASISTTKYHIVVDRTGGVDVANYYEISTMATGTSQRWDGSDWISFGDALVVQFTTTHLVGVISGPIDPRPINRIIGSDPSVNRVWIMGGVGDVVESWFHTNYIPDGGGPGAWHSEIAMGDGVAAFPRDPLETVVDSVVSHQTSGDLGLLFKRNGGGVPTNPYIYTSLFHPVGQADWKFGGGAMVTPGADGVGVEGDNLQLQEFLCLLDNQTSYVSNDGLGFWPIPDVFPGTGANRPHHLINVSAWKDIYLAASDEGIAKTIDRGASWAFFRPMGTPINTTWPSGAIGYEVAFDYRGPAANPSFKLLISIHSGSRTATVIRNGIGPWTMQSDDGTDWPTVDLYSFPALTRIFRTRNDHSNPDPRGITPSIWETLQYSDNYGIDWVDTSVLQCPDITRASNGFLYALSGDGDDHAHKVFRSEDDGDTWIEAKSDNTLYGGLLGDYRRIVADPTNKNVVIAISYQAALMRTVAASTGGPWTVTTPTFTAGFERTNLELLIGQNNRIFVAYEHSSAQRVLIDYNDTDGVNPWHNSLTRDSSGNEPPRMMFTGAKDIYFMHAALSGLSRSRDNGASWESFTDIANHALLRGYAWDAQNNILYCGTEHYELTGDPDTDIEQMHDPTITFGFTGTWVQVGQGIADATGYTVNKLCSEGMECVK